MDDDIDEMEHTLLVVREVNVYKVPPQNTSGGYKCAEWLVSSKIWSGRLRVVSVKDVCEIRLEDTNTGELFATCRVLPGQREATVQSAVDSSRYFVLKIDDGRGRHAFIGLGFTERNEAFDFNVALSDHEKHARQAKEKVAAAPIAAGTAAPAAPSADFRLKGFWQGTVDTPRGADEKEGETIRINMKPKSDDSKPGLGLSSKGGLSGGPIKPLAPPPASGGGFRLAPPPGAGGIKLAPPPSSAGPTIAAPQPTATPTNPPQAQQSKPSAGAPPAAGWTSF